MESMDLPDLERRLHFWFVRVPSAEEFRNGSSHGHEDLDFAFDPLRAVLTAASKVQKKRIGCILTNK